LERDKRGPLSKVYAVLLLIFHQTAKKMAPQVPFLAKDPFQAYMHFSTICAQQVEDKTAKG